MAETHSQTTNTKPEDAVSNGSVDEKVPKHATHKRAKSTPEDDKTERREKGFFGQIKGFLGFSGSDSKSTSETDVEADDTLDNESHSRTSKSEKKSLWKQVQSLIGTDAVSMISLPIWLFEPTTFLTRMAECFRYSELLDKAARCESEEERLMWIAAFNVAALSNIERMGKPFNPVLGETFEYVHPSGLKFIAEQVSHHPPIAASYTQGNGWTMTQLAHVKTQFNGNSIDIFPVGFTHFTLTETGTRYSWNLPTTSANNIFLGRKWIEVWGPVDINPEEPSPESSSMKVHLNFIKSGWFGTRNQVEGHVIKGDDAKKISLRGKWTSSLKAYTVSTSGEKDIEEDEREIWHKEPEVCNNKWQLPNFVNDMLTYEQRRSKLPATDSRLRTDRMALEVGDSSTAGAEKDKIEDYQRKNNKQENFVPQFFKKTEDNWEYIGGYWELYE